MDDKDDRLEEKETYYEDEETKKRFPGFLLLLLITTFGVMLVLGLSFSVVKYMDSNETINTLISSLKGDDNKDNYIITYVENTGDYGDNSKKNTADGSIFIESAKFYESTNGGSGEVVYYGGLMLTTKTNFENNSSSVTYQVVIKNDSSITKTFNQLFYNKDGDVTYSLTGIKEGDKISAGESVIAYLTVKYNGKDNEYPKTIESSSNLGFDEQDGDLHIENATYYKSTNDGKGKVIYYGGLMLTTETTFKSNNSTVTYEITLKNDSKDAKTFTGLKYNQDGKVKYTLSGINEGDKLASGESKVVYLIVENNGNNEFPTTVESSVSFDFSDFGVSSQENGIYLVNQFSIKDEVGKLFQGRNYVFNFTLLVGKKTAGAYYELTAVPNADNTLEPSYVKLYLEKNGKGVDLSYRSNGRVKVFTEYGFSEHEETEGRVIYKGYVTEEDAKNGRIEFVMRMWVTEDLELDDETSANYFNKKFSAKVNTYAAFLDK